MTIDWRNESVLSLNEAAKQCPGRPSLSSIWRWCTKGTAGGIKLESFTRAGRRFTSAEALTRFFEATTAVAAGNTPAAPTPVPTKQRRREVEAAERFCQAAGI